MSLEDRLVNITRNYHIDLKRTFECSDESYLLFQDKLEWRKEEIEKNKTVHKNLIDKIKKSSQNKKLKLFTKLKDEELSEEGRKHVNEALQKIENEKEKWTILELTKEEMQLYQVLNTTNYTNDHITHILNMSVIYLFSIFEAFNKDFFREILLERPEIMKSKTKNINYEEIINLASIQEIHKWLVTKEIDGIGYMNIDDFGNFLKNKFNIDLKEYPYWDELREQYYRRNIIVHNSGKISELYIDKMSLNLSDIGKKLEVDFDYIQNCFLKIHDALTYIASKVFEKFKLSKLDFIPLSEGEFHSCPVCGRKT